MGSELRIDRIRYDGTVLSSKTEPVSVEAHGALRRTLPAELTAAGDPASELVSAGIDGRRTEWFFVEARDSNLQAAQLDVTPTRTDQGWVVGVRAAGLTRDVVILIDRVDPAAQVDQGLVTLLPGETSRLSITGAGNPDPDDFSIPQVIRTANDLLKPTAIRACLAHVLLSHISPGVGTSRRCSTRCRPPGASCPTRFATAGRSARTKPNPTRTSRPPPS